jgi:hypothetical protein
MTKQESFKRRVRARMAATGERYAAARRAMLTPAGAPRRRTWVAEPEVADASVLAATGRGWDDWCDAIDESPVAAAGHTAIATHLREVHGVDAWWAQTVTVGYERITGLRLPHQRPDGTFSVARSKTLSIDGAWLRAALLDDDLRADLLGGLPSTIRSRAQSKVIRMEVGPGVVLVDLQARPDGKAKITVTHERLPHADDVGEWRYFWSEWLDALEAADTDDA